MDNSILSVSQFITRINIGLKKAKVKIIGEVGRADVGPKGHVYFTLRDENKQSVISCAIWKFKYDLFGIELKEGLKVIISGAPEIYPSTGRLSLIVTSLEIAGEGVLKKEYEKLKKKLSEEGIFAPERKREIPQYPKKIGLITSLRGAVIADFSNNLGKYGFEVKIIDCRVEGQEAVSDILGAIRTFKKKDIELLVIMRGGGALETLAPLMPFNNEKLVREVAKFPVPVISAIGHHKDVPLLSMASDFNVSTPSIAATTINRSWDNLLSFLENEERKIFYSYQDILKKGEESLKTIATLIKDSKELIFKKYEEIENKLRVSYFVFKNNIINVKINFEGKKNKIILDMERCLDEAINYLEKTEKIVFANSPERQLSLGYSITRAKGKILKSVQGLLEGEEISVALKDGSVISNVKKIIKKN